MEHYKVYLSGLVYKALELKRTAQQFGRLDMKHNQFVAYYNLVIAELEKARQVANSFTYEIMPFGEPPITNIANSEFLKKLQNTTFTYNEKTGMYTTYSDLTSLRNKALRTNPRPLKSYLAPNGHEYALGMFPSNSHELPNEINLPELGDIE